MSLNRPLIRDASAMMKLCLLAWLGMLHFSIFAQDLAQIGKKDTLKNAGSEPAYSIYGNLNVSLRGYRAWEIENRQYPYSSTVAANVTVKTKFGLTVPFSFVLHNLDEDDSPFQSGYWDGFLTNQGNRLTRIGASPYYKKFKAHLGHRYMNFSEFTLANHNFLGVGVEMYPNKWRIAAMAGRLSKAEPQSLSLTQPNIQQYTRTGYGFKFGYGTDLDYIDVCLFSAQDDPNSLDFQNDSLFIVTPQENLVVSLRGRKTLDEHFSIQFELAESALTRNTRDADYDEGFVVYNSFLFQRKSSSMFRTAADVKLEYKHSGNNFRSGLEYRRIDPQYTSLGAYFFNEDLENVTAYANFSLLQKTQKPLRLYLQAGLQRNNLDGKKEAAFKRFIGSANAQYAVNNWNFGANLSNFNSRVDYQLNPELDSLNAVIVSQEIYLSASKIFPGNGESFQVLNLIGGLQSVNDQVENPQQSAASDLYFANVSYTISTRTRWQYTATSDFNSNSLSGNQLNRYGIGFLVSKGSKDSKFQTGLGMNYYLQTSSENYENHLWSNFIRGTWQLFKNQSFNFQINWLRNNKTGTGPNAQYSELMGTVGYNLKFNYQPSPKAKTELQ